ncbi:BnaC09g28790D [Brassica napus]|uniref:BnaC09g28790D protein n=2 Tax=Brassica napus TaxID=3708 RepID=A0A078GRQ5_BRANA|nr:BnaC09g28790D [Brassica napus]
MVSQSNATGSSGRRQRPNTPKAKPVSRSKKTKRYPFSDSDDDTTPSSMDSTAPTSPPVDAVDAVCSANVIASVASALKGSSAMDRLLCSQFSKLFRLPVARCPNSTKLIGSLLCRKLITIRKYELWFTFDSETEVNEPGSMWKQLFDTTRWWTGFCVVLIKHSSSPKYVEMLSNLLLAFEAVPQLLARIPDADNTNDFLDNPSCCGNTVVILNTNDIVAVEGEPDVIVDFSLVPEAERHFWLDEVEDPKVTRLVDHIRSGHTFRTEDFEGGDRHPNTTNPTFRLNQEDQFEKTLCDHFGVPLPNIHNKGKRKRPNLKSRKINSTVPKPGQEMHSYPLHSADGLEGTIGNTQPGFSRETRENNENSTLLTPQFDQNATDKGQFDQNTTYQSYVSPAKKDDTYIGEKAVDVKWDEANPHAYSAVKETNRAIFKKFSDILSENVEQQLAIKTNHIVTNSFFLGIATPGNWLPDEHMHVIMQMLWRRRGSVLQKDRRVMCDPYFTKIITSKWSAFSEAKDKLHFDWGTNIASYVTGMCRGKNLKLQLGRDIDVYVGFTDYLIKEEERTYAWNRFQGIYHNNRGGDCGPCAAKFMEMHSNGDGKEEMSRITDKVVDKFCEQYAIDCYEEFVSDFQVANEAEMK